MAAASPLYAATLSGRVLYESHALWFSHATSQEQWRTLVFPSRTLRKNLPERKGPLLQRGKRCCDGPRAATDPEEHTPVIFVLENNWSTTLREDERYYINNRTLRLI